MGMVEKISNAQLTLLNYLDAHSGDFSQRVWLDPRFITRDLRISMIQFAEDSSSLAAQGLAGLRDFRADSNDVPSLKCSAIWLTKEGKEYLRQAQFQVG